MPTVGIFSQNYWNNSDTTVVVVSRVGNYPMWQAAPISLVMGASPGAELWAALAVWLRRLWGAVTMAWRLRTLDTERQRVLGLTIASLESQAYPQARIAVRMTAERLGLNEPAAWVQISHDLHRRHAWAENTWRHLHACDLLDDLVRAHGSTVSNQERTLVTELAYRGFATSNSTKALR